MGVVNPFAGSPAPHAAGHQLGGADPVALGQYDNTDGQAGILFPTGQGWRPGRPALTALWAYAARGRPSRNIAVTLAAFELSVAAGVSTDTIEIAIFDAPCTTKLATSGAVAGLIHTGSGVKTVPLAYTLLAGTIYYVAVQVSAAAQLSLSDWDLATSNALFGNTRPQRQAFNTGAAVASPMPNTLTPGGASGWGAKIALRES